nr:MAG TPA: hypothetical protein [Caudoviricetes sp.]
MFQVVPGTTGISQLAVPVEIIAPRGAILPGTTGCTPREQSKTLAVVPDTP